MKCASKVYRTLEGKGSDVICPFGGYFIDGLRPFRNQPVSVRGSGLDAENYHMSMRDVSSHQLLWSVYKIMIVTKAYQMHSENRILEEAF